MKKGNVLLFFWLCLGVGFLPPSLTLALELKPGVSLFKTAANGDTFISLSSVGGPSKIPLQGNAKPLAPFASKLLPGFETGNLDKAIYSADSAVEIKEGIDINRDGEITTEIELVALSLKSIQPFDIGFLSDFQEGTMTDLYVTVGVVGPAKLSNKTTTKPSTGKMTVRHEQDNGGSFDFKLEVYPDLIFVKAGGDINNPQDWLFALPYQDKPFNISNFGTWFTNQKGMFLIQEMKPIIPNQARLEEAAPIEAIHYALAVASVLTEGMETTLAILISPPSPTTSGDNNSTTQQQEDNDDKGGDISPKLNLEIKPGFNSFKTVANGDTFINLSSVGGPPKVPLEGNAKPLAKFNRELLNKVNNVKLTSLAAIDTVVGIKEKKGINLSKGDEVTGELELLALSLKSIEALDIGFLNDFPKGTMADLYVTVNVVDPTKLNSNFTKKPSIGKMIVRYEKENGGSFNFDLEVYPVLTFVKVGGNFNNSQDWLFTTLYTGEPIDISGTGTWLAQNEIFVIDRISQEHAEHDAELVTSITRDIVNLTPQDVMSLVTLPSPPIEPQSGSDLENPLLPIDPPPLPLDPCSIFPDRCYISGTVYWPSEIQVGISILLELYIIDFPGPRSWIQECWSKEDGKFSCSVKNGDYFFLRVVEFEVKNRVGTICYYSNWQQVYLGRPTKVKLNQRKGSCISIPKLPIPLSTIDKRGLLGDELAALPVDEITTEILMLLEPPPPIVIPQPPEKITPILNNLFTPSKTRFQSGPSNRIPVRFGALSLTHRSTNDRDNNLSRFNAPSQAFLTTLGESLASFNLSEVIVETHEEMSRLEVPLFTSESDSASAWYSAFATEPVMVRNKKKSATGLFMRSDGAAYLVFEGEEQQYYESNLLPTLDSDIAKALMTAMPVATLEQSLEGEVLVSWDNEVHQVKMDYVVTATDSDALPLNIVVDDVNKDGKVDYILSAVGKQQIAFGQ